MREPQELLKERRERVEKALTGGTPDRVPYTVLPAIDLQAGYAGMTVAELCFNWDSWVANAAKWGRDFNVEGMDLLPFFPPALEGMIFAVAWADYPEWMVPTRFITGPFHETLKDKWTRWPGRELPQDFHPQFIGGIFMEPEEYRKLAEDPVEFITGTVFPRAIESLRKPHSPEAAAALMRLGVETKNFNTTMARIGAEAAKLGFPSFYMGYGYAPLDIIGDFLRMPTGVMLDLRRRPDEVLQALEALTPLVNKAIKNSTIPLELSEKLFGTRVVQVFWPLHLNEMLPPKLFEEFYWPSLKETILYAIELGYVPWIFFEGDFTRFLSYLLELPKGKVFAYFEKADLRRAREVLGDHVGIGGGIPVSLLMHGEREKVYEESCRLLNDLKEPGGFIFYGSGVSPGAATKIENIWAQIDAVNKCGRY
ncbi:MAG: uroporphyrinogen decarboxylase family protein [Infirmifilum sp.]